MIPSCERFLAGLRFFARRYGLPTSYDEVAVAEALAEAMQSMLAVKPWRPCLVATASMLAVLGCKGDPPPTADPPAPLSAIGSSASPNDRQALPPAERVFAVETQ